MGDQVMDDVVGLNEATDGEGGGGGEVRQLSKLDEQTVRKLQTGQIITCPVAVLKELVENSLDAGASWVAVEVQESPFKSMAVRDDGAGIPSEHRQQLCAGFSTSKLGCYEDLRRLETYGFRGEALHALCEEADVSVTTRCTGERHPERLAYDHRGALASRSPAACHQVRGGGGGATGTEVVAEGLFRRKPVRLQYHARQAAEGLWRRLHETVLEYALARPAVAFSLQYPSRPLFRLPRASSPLDRLHATHGARLAAQLAPAVRRSEGGLLCLSGLFPRLDAEPNTVLRRSSANQRAFVFLNARPVSLPAVASKVRARLRAHFGPLYAKFFPFFVLSIDLPPHLIDINLSPDKRKVLFSDLPLLTASVDALLDSLYPLPLPLPLPVGIDRDEDHDAEVQVEQDRHPQARSTSSTPSPISSARHPFQKPSRPFPILLDDDDDFSTTTTTSTTSTNSSSSSSASSQSPRSSSSSSANSASLPTTVVTLGQVREGTKRSRTTPSKGEPLPPAVAELHQMRAFWSLLSAGPTVAPSVPRFVDLGIVGPGIRLVSETIEGRLYYVHLARLAETLRARASALEAQLPILVTDQLSMLLSPEPSADLQVLCPHHLPILTELPLPMSMT